MSSSWKMLIFIFFLIAFYTGFGMIMNWQLSHIASLVEKLHEHPMAVTRSALTAGRDTMAVSRNAKDMVLVTDDEHRRTRLAEIEMYEKSAEQNMQLVLDRIKGAEGKELAKRAMQLIKEQKELRIILTNEIFRGNTQKAAALARVEGSALMRKMEAVMTKISNYAETQSMHYRVESINDLRNSKVILYSAGLIIAVLSIVFVVFSGRWLLRALTTTRNAILKAAEVPIDLTTVVNAPFFSGINSAINTLFQSLYQELHGLATHASRLESELKDSQALEGKLPEMVDSIATKLKSITQAMQSLPESHVYGERSHRVLTEIFRQIKGDLALLGQFTESQKLKIKAVKLKKEEGDIPTLLASMEQHEKTVQETLDRTVRSIESAADLASSLHRHMTELLKSTSEQTEVISDLYHLEDPIKNYERHLSRLREILFHLNKSLKSLKLS